MAACTTPSILVTQEQKTGDELNNKGDYDQAVIHYQKCLEASMKLGVYRNTDMEAKVCRKTSHAYEATGHFSDARTYIGYAYTLDSMNRNQLGMLQDVREKGKIEMMSGDLLKGMETLKKAVVMSEGMENSLKDINRDANAEVHMALAQANLMLGNFDDARQEAEQALKIFNNTGDLSGQAEANLVLGSIASDQADPGRAMHYLERSAGLAFRAGLNTARQSRGMAEIMLFTGEYEKALRYMFQAKEKADSSGILPQRVWMEMGLGDVYRFIGDQEKSDPYYQKALELAGEKIKENHSMKASLDWRQGNVFEAGNYFTSQQSKVASGLVMLRMGELYIQQVLPDSALPCFTGAKEWFEKAQSPEGITRSDLYLARVLLDQKKGKEAVFFLTDAESNNKNPDLTWQIDFLYGLLREQSGQKDQAIEAYRKAIKEIESIRNQFCTDELKSSYMNNKTEVYDRLLRLLMEKGKEREALQLAEQGKARAFLDLLGNQKVGQQKEHPDPLAIHEQALSSRIVQLKKQYVQGLYESLGLSQARLSREIINDEITRAQDEYTEVLLELKLKNPAYASLVSVQPVDISKMQQSLPENTSLVEYWTGKNGSIAWLIRQDTILAYSLPAGTDSLFALVKNIREAIENRLPEQDKLLREGYLSLFAPFEKDIRPGQVLGILPHGSLHLLPFQALMDSKKKFIAQQYILFYSPSASVLFQEVTKPSVPGNKLFAMALGNMDVGIFNGLPGTKKEIDGITPLFPDHATLSEQKLTEESMKAMAPGYQVIHLATHGYFNEDQPLYSFLLFSPTTTDDGHLTLPEIFSLSLNANLVTLSACQTGLGKLTAGDEMTGLSRAFLYAGSRSVIVSLWSVADEPTSALMVQFYKNLGSCSTAEALAKAERSVMNKWPQPFYWAPFQLIGNPFTIH